jgi:hypothetical protein
MDKRAIPTIKPKKPDPETVSRPAEIKPVTPPPDSEPERDDDDDWNVELVSFSVVPSLYVKSLHGCHKAFFKLALSVE